MSELLAAKQHQSPFPLELANKGIEAKRLELQAQRKALKLREQRLAALQKQINLQFAPTINAPANTQTPA